ncbi:MAG: BMC domain-containing protein [Firmicutes bacterium]|nr:BMC domain-containing protein [Bacillota bacterium]
MVSASKQHKKGRQPFDALGFLEIQGAARGIQALDAGCKTASINVLKANVACPDKYTILFTGSAEDVAAAYSAAAAAIGAGYYDGCQIGRVHPDLAHGLMGIFGHTGCERNAGWESAPKGESDTPKGSDAVGVLETLSIASGIKTADCALKAGYVVLKELHLGYALGGRSYWLITGDTAAVQAAMEAAADCGKELGRLGSYSLILQPGTQVS